MRVIGFALLALLATSACARRHVTVKHLKNDPPAAPKATPAAVETEKKPNPTKPTAAEKPKAVAVEKKPAVEEKPVPPPKVEAPLVNAAAKKNSLRAAPAPAAPAPAPLTQKDHIEAMKAKMAKKVGHYDADYVLDRPTTVPPGHDGQVAPGPKTNLVPNQKPVPAGPAGAPGAAPAPAPAPVPDTGMTEAALNALVKHNDNETMTDDWGQEYGPHGPRGVHGPYQPMAGHSSANRNGLGALFGALFAATLLSCRGA